MRCRSEPGRLAPGRGRDGPARWKRDMSWFEQLCRNVGLMVHNIKHPDGPVEKKVVNKTVEEMQVDETTVLRRTTIEEIEIQREPRK